MTNPGRPTVECEQQHPSLFVRDVPTAVEFYTQKLGFSLGFIWGEPPSMAGVNLGKMQIFLERGTPDPNGCSLYFVVGNADELCEFQRANGVKILVEPDDREYGLRDYRVSDLHGYNISFGHRTCTDGEPIAIERVDVPVRLEKRLAALLADLATRKRMSVGGCLEEILLHTNDGVTPHTAGEVEFIQELKKKHGINYDAHASYRFVEKQD
ncbi:MAG TPA: VOC family protein [Gemmatimonadaceae bacterium]|jgi:catechol 2,3-dioxygenase-like lactoylglutathione lyase family enzyme